MPCEHVLADLGVVHAGGVPVTFYPTLAADQVGYIADDCDARIAVLDGARELARWQPVLARLPGLKKIVVRDAAVCPAGDQYLTWADFSALGRQRLAAAPGAVAGRVAAIRPGDPVTVLYTSGTTGNPKGVIITHRSVLCQLAAAGATGFMMEHSRGVSYLPLAHIAERMGAIYGQVYNAGHVYFCHNAAELAATLGAVQPTAFFGVPRVWEKIQARIQALLTLNGDVAPAWARARGIEASSLAELAGEPAVLAAVTEAMADANERLARVQQVKRWRLLPVEWTAESEELTPTFKLRRPVVHAKYADVIDTLYAD